MNLSESKEYKLNQEDYNQEFTMTMLKVREHEFELSHDGYMLHREEWTEEVAAVIAGDEGIRLNDDHWDIIYFLREYYDEFQISPNVKVLVKEMKKVLADNTFSTKKMYDLFPKGPAFQGCRIAGLPKPTNCIDG